MAYDRDVDTAPRRDRNQTWIWVIVGVIIIAIVLFFLIPALTGDDDAVEPVDDEVEVVDEGAFRGDRLGPFAVDGVEVVIAA